MSSIHTYNAGTIKTISPFCKFCYKEFINGDVAYLADMENFIVCKKCLTTEGVVSTFHDVKNHVYARGIISITEVKKK